MISVIKGKTIVRSGDGCEVSLRALLNGELGIVDWCAIQALKGRAFNVSAGSVTTALTPGATATIDITKPVIWINVPVGTTVIPVSLEVYMEAFGSNAQFELSAQIGTGGGRTSGGTAVTPTNLRADLPGGSVVTAYAGDNTPVFVGSTANVSEFWHDGKQFAITKTAESATVASHDPSKFSWSAKDMLVMPIAVGGSQIAVYQGSQAGTCFAKLQFIEIPSSELP